jgi:hypothetical protein
MARQRESKAAPELYRVRNSIEVWRRTRLKRSPMPEEIWAEAMRLARRLGVWRVTSALGLCYESLRRRVEEKSTQTRASAPRFVEMRASDLVGMARHDGAVVELCATDGTRMTVRLCEGMPVDMTALVGAFRRRGK